MSKCDRVLILSAKWGPVEPPQVLAPYDKVITELTAHELAEWTAKCRQYILSLSPDSVLSYLSSNYDQGLLAGLQVDRLSGGMYERAAAVGPQGKMKRGKQTVCWPINWILTLVAEKRPTLATLTMMLREKGYAEPTVQAQLFRAKICPLHRIVDGWLENIYSELKDLDEV